MKLCRASRSEHQLETKRHKKPILGPSTCHQNVQESSYILLGPKKSVRHGGRSGNGIGWSSRLVSGLEPGQGWFPTRTRGSNPTS